MSEELLPCPFCGQSNAIICETEHLMRPAYVVTCRTKKCAGGVYMMGHGEFVAVEDAIKAWNTRTDSKPYKYENPEQLIQNVDSYSLGFHHGFNAARERKE